MDIENSGNIMGIHKLMSLILEKAKNAVKNITLDSLTGRIIACDASTVNGLNLTYTIGHVSIFDFKHHIERRIWN